MNTRAKGNRLECLVAKKLESEGYTFILSRRSRGLYDVAVWNEDELRLIQVSSNQLPPLAERQAMSENPVPEGTKKECWVRKRGKWVVYPIQDKTLR